MVEDESIKITALKKHSQSAEDRANKAKKEAEELRSTIKLRSGEEGWGCTEARLR